MRVARSESESAAVFTGVVLRLGVGLREHSSPACWVFRGLMIHQDAGASRFWTQGFRGGSNLISERAEVGGIDLLSLS